MPTLSRQVAAELDYENHGPWSHGPTKMNDMPENNSNYCLILAGGKGRRLWPCSREDCPKQFLDFFSTGRTILQQTYDRMAAFIPGDHILVCTNRAYTHLVAEQLPELPEENILSEPVQRNTAPSVAWATFRIYHTDPDARIVVVPSDQTVLKEDVFRSNILAGLDFTGGNDVVLSMGIKPTRPEPGYGYIQMGEPAGGEGVYWVKSFTEKPDRDFARMFMDNGEFYWNTGIFISSVRHLRSSLMEVLPSVLSQYEESDFHTYSREKELAFIEDNFSRYPNLSIDYAILDRKDNVCIMTCGFGWADLGMWHSIYESMSKGEGDNVVIGSHVIIDGSHNNIIKLPDDHMGIINGLDGYIIAEKGNVLLICRKEDSSSLVRKYINEVQVKYGEEFI